MLTHGGSVSTWSRDCQEADRLSVYPHSHQAAKKVAQIAPCGRGSALAVINNLPSRDRRERSF
jgi:hypothetical protein